ncbi:MAG: hypothetical protein M3N02_02750 [Pseudomonadota bacterium]|nr:hypothetical protein [Pseudomonadota bacterium]
MAEITKRLPPTGDTLRELYLKSGNRCAFPGCEKALFNAVGVFVAQICHIESAMPGGERFNAGQTNEERRRPSNLVLLCYDHHVETDDVDKFPVERMRRIKEDHERLFSDVIGTMLRSVSDHTKLSEPTFPKNLRRLNDALGWAYSDQELAEALTEALPALQKYATLPLPTRQFFSIIVDRGQPGRFGATLAVSADEVQQAANLSDDEARKYFALLDRHGFTEHSDTDDFGLPIVGVCTLRSGWPLWSDIKKFCERRGLDPAIMLHGLDFGDLDKE